VTYTAPIAEQLFVLETIAGIDNLAALPPYAGQRSSRRAGKPPCCETFSDIVEVPKASVFGEINHA
jgi:hypothetical protein